MTAVQPAGGGNAQEELAAVGVGARIGHAEDARTGVKQGEVLIFKAAAVNGVAAGAVVRSEVATLDGAGRQIVPG